MSKKLIYWRKFPDIFSLALPKFAFSYYYVSNTAFQDRTFVTEYDINK